MTDPEYLMLPGVPPPPPTAIYSHAVRSNGFLFVTGQLGCDPASGALVAGGAVAQAHQIMRNLQQVARAADTSLERAVMARIYLTDFADYAAVNAVYGSYFEATRRPARTTVGVTGLAMGAAVEIDLIIRL
jgi:2-iminobutanoate/2-iminopropanoate deaminase